MSKGGGQQQSSTTQTNKPWEPLQPYLTGGYQNQQGRFVTPTDKTVYGPNGEILSQGKQFGENVTYRPGLYEEASNWYKGDSPMFYPGSTVAPLSSETDLALNLQAGRALSGSPLTDAAQNEAYKTMSGGYMGMDPSIGYLTPTARGDYLNANPYLDKTYDRAADAIGRSFKNIVEPGIASRFAMGGRSGSGLQADAFSNAQQNLGNTLTNLATDIYGGNYTTERQNQLMAGRALSDPYQAERSNQYKSMLFAPSLAQQDYFDIGQLAEAGAERGAYGQQLTNADIERFNFEQNQPLMKLQALNQLLQGGMNFGSNTATTSQPLYRNRLGGALGGAATGFQMTGSPIGAGIGGLLGLLS